ncbi:MAG: hypothetical protein JXA54_00700 [Candidatus Heimdallarchaeota archaeon]|nr:hypothetical protein [Candidatus Heimdallarchaeota archaeon]
MASKTDADKLALEEDLLDVFDLDSLDYCNDCLYDWCTKRSLVVFCTMKTKGLFECKTCLMMLSNKEL